MTFTIIEKILAEPAKISESSVPSDVFVLLGNFTFQSPTHIITAKCSSFMSDDKIFPCLDLKRLLLLHPRVVEHYATESTEYSIPEKQNKPFNTLLETLLKKCISLALAEGTTAPTRLMSLRLVSHNILWTYF